MRYILDHSKKNMMLNFQVGHQRKWETKDKKFFKKINSYTNNGKKNLQKEWFKIPFKELNIRLSLNRLPD